MDNADVQARLKRLSWVMDNSIRLPTGHRIGIDGLIGLIPGVGDAVGAAISGYFVVQAARLNVPKPIMARMLLNIVTEAIVGAVPVLGDLFDLAFKANARNYHLLENYFDQPRRVQQRSTALVAASTVGAVAVVALAIFGAIALLRAIWGVLFG